MARMSNTPDRSPGDDFMTYIRLSGRLHRMIRDGTDEGPEGEAIRDQMDGPGDRLTEDEVQAVKEISALLGSLYRGPSPAL